LGISTEFTLDGVQLSKYNIYIGREGSQGMWSEDLLSDVENYTDSVFGMNGSYDFGMRFADRPITIPIYTDGITEAQKNEVQRILLAKTPKMLVLNNEPYRFLWVKSTGKTELKFVQYSDRKYRGFAEVQYVALNPFFYSYYTALDYELHSEYLDAVNSIYEYFDILPYTIVYLAPFMYSVSRTPCIHSSIAASGYKFSLLNLGNENAKLVVGLNGSCENMTLTNTSMNTSFTISAMIAEKVLVDGTRGIVSNGDLSSGVIANETTLKTALHTGAFLELQPGRNNFTLTADSVSLSNMIFSYRHTFL
jgi:hypothetical protein